jgi:hypothetical protein
VCVRVFILKYFLNTKMINILSQIKNTSFENNK